MASTRRISVARAVVKSLIAEKVEFVFGLVGSYVLAIYNALVDAPNIKHVVVKHENNAAFMAGMYGYLTGKPGVVVVTAGPGATNSISGVAQAYNQSMPMVHICAGVPLGSGNAAYHGVDREDFLYKMFLDITKWSVRVEQAEEIPSILSQAFCLTVSGRPGPVSVEIPSDIILAKDVEMPIYRPSSVKTLSPQEKDVILVFQMLAKSQRPIICVGRGVLVHRAEAELILLAEAISAPVLSTFDSNGVIADDHDLAVGILDEWKKNTFSLQLLKESDFLLCLGLRSNTSFTKYLAKKAPKNVVFIALDEKHTLHFMDNMTTVFSDTLLFLSQLLLHIDEFRRPADSNLKSRIAKHKIDLKKRLDMKMNLQRGLPQRLTSFKNNKSFNFGLLIEELFSRLEKDAIIVSGVGNHAIWAKALSHIKNRESFIQEGSWGTMGSELAGGIAAKLVYPERQVVVITGDGSLLMGSSDFVTAVEVDANILVVVLNDSRYGMITAMQQMRFGRSLGDKIGKINFEQFAQSFGAEGLRIETVDELTEAVEQAISLNIQKPVILDAVCSHELHGYVSVVGRKLRKMKKHIIRPF